MRVVVTGGAGYVGSVLVPLLLQRGHEVVVFDACLYGTAGLEAIAECADRKQHLSIVRGPLEDPPHNLLQGADAVLHLCGYSNDPTAEFAPQRTMVVNVTGTDKLIRLAENAWVERFILASSASLYDRETERADVLDETAPIAAQSTYSRSKQLCEQLLFASKIPCPIALRKGTIFGWSPRMRWDLVVNTMVRDALLAGVITVANEGTMWRPLLHVGDAARAYLFAAEAHERLVRGQIFNVVQDNYQIRDVARVVRDLCAAFDHPVALEPKPGVAKPRDYRISGAKLAKAGFSPTVSVGTGAFEVVEKAGMWSKKALADPHGENIAWLKVMAEVETLLATGVRP
jgi:nucleoside-diphosphate-sugar epimerase